MIIFATTNLSVRQSSALSTKGDSRRLENFFPINICFLQNSFSRHCYRFVAVIVLNNFSTTTSAFVIFNCHMYYIVIAIIIMSIRRYRQCREPAPSSLNTTVHLYHDSNLRGVTPSSIQRHINDINTTLSETIKTYNIKTYLTFELQQTYDTIRFTTIHRNDIVILNIMTNDARHTKNRRQKTLLEAQHLQRKIIHHILRYTSPKNIILMESPPLIHHNIYGYNYISHETARLFGLRFAGTLIGNQHLWKDGVHILHSSRDLLHKSVAAAIAGVNPHQHYRLSRPPFGAYGTPISPFR